MSDGRGLGDDGTVFLREYLPLAESLWFSLFCQPCGRVEPVSVHTALRLVGAGGTVGRLRSRARCQACRGPMGLTVSTDARPHEAMEKDGPAPETRGR